MDAGEAARTLADAGFTVIDAPAPRPEVGGITASWSRAVEVICGGSKAVISTYGFGQAYSAAAAGSFLGGTAQPGRRYFAAGPTLVVVEADDPATAEAACTALEEAERWPFDP